MNLSSSEDEFSSVSSTNSSMLRGRVIGNPSKAESEDVEFDEINWEDVDIHQGFDNKSNEETKHSIENGVTVTVPKNSVTIDLHDCAVRPETKSKKCKKPRQFRKIQKISPQLKALTLDIHRAHLLSLTSRAIHLSSFSGLPTSTSTGDEKVIYCLAHSLIRLDFLDENYQNILLTEEKHDEKNEMLFIIPTRDLLERFCKWFFEFINHITTRREHIRRANMATGVRKSTRRRRGKRRSMSPKCRKEKLKNEVHFMKTIKTLSKDAKSTTLSNCVFNRKRQRLLHILQYISPTNDEDVSIELDACTILPEEKNLIFACMAR